MGSGVIAFILGWRRDLLEPSSYKISRGQADESALEKSNERYARGEIDEEEYLKRKKTLNSKLIFLLH